MMKEKSDIAIANVACVEEWKTLDDCMRINLFNTEAVESMTGRQLIIRTFFEDLGVVGIVAWNKLFKRELWSDISFPDDPRHEDQGTIYQIIYPLEKCSVIKENLYFYRRDNGSFMDQHNWERVNRLSEILFDQAEYFRQQDDIEIYTRKLAGAMQYLAGCILGFMADPELTDVVAQRTQYFREKYRTEVKKSEISKKQKLALGLFTVNRKLYGWLLKRKGIL